MDEALLDTDILSEVLKRKNPHVLKTAASYLCVHQRFAFFAITVYEIVRGMKATNATRQLSEFLRTVGTSDVYPVSILVLMRAAELWAEARNNGYPQHDADLIIAATALESQRVLVTGNMTHYSWVNGLRLADWRVATP